MKARELAEAILKLPSDQQELTIEYLDELGQHEITLITLWNNQGKKQTIVVDHD
jgi:hypothetical protein